MFLAELKGKLSSKQENSEDLLTSNVFSFFKYARRDIYLNALVKQLDITCTSKDLEEAEFVFWPTYDDYTEPDFVLIVGNHYILFEAKLFADFGEESGGKKSQIEREIEGGLNEAKSLEKQFHFIALTAHYHYPKECFASFPYEISKYIRWMNWQAIASLILNLLESGQKGMCDMAFAQDLYDLLDKKNLRGFLSFSRINNKIDPVTASIFFSAQTASFRGAFIGITPALEAMKQIDKPPARLFYRRKYFQRFPLIVDGPICFRLGGSR